MRNRSPFLARAIVVALVALGTVPALSPAHAQGFFDDLDRCIAAKDGFNEGRNQMRAIIQAKMDAASTAKPTEEYRDLWWEEKRKQMREYFDKSQFASIIKASGGSLDKAFVLWLAEQIEAAGGVEKIDAVIDSDFQKMTQLELDRKKNLTEAEFEKQKEQLYGECKEDVLNQTLRGAMTMAMAPINIIEGNWEGAKRESGELAKIIRATTGISWRDIEKYGLCGGPNSEFRKLFGSLC
ncbi:hypothetical protein [Paracoccus marinaquae]|uniref:Lysozyme inhibitor LprI N-terminal domain-containing protein n=1 Tax=Paracoccus marinaquae TaxID=2841926 RepID=A0ABS6AI11_9RHOB|nr:hypothetical protein [Paracoccus marinaquae]MBU3029727.1 hypothetical protein [Paracoccus marinaquae]